MTQFLPRAVSSVFPRATSADDSAAVFYSRETSGPALRGNEPLTRSHMRGPDGAEPPAQSSNSASACGFWPSPHSSSPVAISRGEETRSHYSSARHAFERSQITQALIDVAAALAFLLVGCALAGSVIVVLFVLFLVTS